MFGTKFFISRRWRHYKIVLYLFAFEFAPTIAILALFSIASPNLYRDQLWQQGADLGLNSSPTTILYSYANYKPVKKPLVWSQSITNFNLVISVLSMFLLLTKVTMHLMHCFYPIFCFLTHGLLVGLWAFSVHGQAGSDYNDPDHPSKIPWYISKSCSIAETTKLEGYCKQAKSAFAVSIIMLALYAVLVILSIWSMVPTAEQKLKRQMKRDNEKAAGSPSDEDAEHHRWTQAEWDRERWRATQATQQWEMHNYPQTPHTLGTAVPATPRTKAFHALGGTSPERRMERKGGELPLRERYHQDEESAESSEKP